MANKANGISRPVMPPNMTARDVSKANKTFGGAHFTELQSTMVASQLVPIAGAATPFMGDPVSATAFSTMTPQEYQSMVTDVMDENEGEWMEHFDIDEAGYSYENKAGQNDQGRPIWGGRQWPAQLSVMPTSTINPQRPRTVAAGYDGKREVLTVVFRDGTYYNYYDVPAGVWNRFKQSTSKGRFIYTVLDNYPRGAASVANGEAYNREQVYRAARGKQIVSGPSTVSSFNPKTGKRERHSGVSTKMQQDFSKRP